MKKLFLAVIFVFSALTNAFSMPTATLSGRVFDLNQAPIAGAKVKLVNTTLDFNKSQILPERRRGSEGFESSSSNKKTNSY